MDLEKAIKRNLFQRIRVLILGKEKPNLLTQISVLVGFILWFYLFSWYLLSFLSIALINTLDHPETIKATFTAVGQKYGYTDTMTLLMGHSITEIVVYSVAFIGLILIWRKKKIGFLLFIFGLIGSLLFTFLIMGSDYFVNEIPIIDFILLFCLVLYFGIGALIFYKWKAKT